MTLFETILLVLTSVCLIEFTINTTLSLLVDYEDKKPIGLKVAMLFIIISGLTMIVYKWIS